MAYKYQYEDVKWRVQITIVMLNFCPYIIVTFLSSLNFSAFRFFIRTYFYQTLFCFQYIIIVKDYYFAQPHGTSEGSAY